MEILSANIDEETLIAFRHFEEWASISDIARNLELTAPTAERICWILTGKGLILWKPGKGRKQLFRYNQEFGKKRNANVLNEIDKLFGRDYYITGKTALFLHNLTDYAMYQRIVEIALPKNKYAEIVDKVVENLSQFATVLPENIPKRCSKIDIIADALKLGDVIIVKKALHNPRRLKFYGDLNLPKIGIILEESDLEDKELFEYTLKAIDSNLIDEDLGELYKKKPVLVYLKKYLEGDRDIPKNILDALQEADRSVKGY